jgi:hypothetical protein
MVKSVSSSFRTRRLALLASIALGIAGSTHPTLAQPSQPAAGSATVQFPATAAGRLAAAYFEAFNSGDREKFRAFETRYRAASALAERPVDQRLERYDQLRKDLGDLRIDSVQAGGPEDVSAVVQSSATGDWVVMGFELEKAEPHGLIGIQLEISSEKPAPAAPLDAPAKATAIDAIAEALTAYYVFPETGEKMADMLRKNAAAGAYAGISTDAAFARKLTDDLRDICHDKHLAVRPGPVRAHGGEDEAMTAEQLQGLRRENFAFRRTEILPGNIGYVKFDGFVGVKEAEPTAAAAMNFVANCDALIFDLRENGGGSPEMINFICGYLFDSPTLLNRFYNRPTDDTTESYSRADVPGARYGQDKPVYVLTSHSTFSGAEEFCYDLQNLKRGTVVGEVTGGGAHPVSPRPAGPRFSVFVPYARAINPVTETNWEGKGIQPDIAVAADEALEAAVKAAREHVGR